MENTKNNVFLLVLYKPVIALTVNKINLSGTKRLRQFHAKKKERKILYKLLLKNQINFNYQIFRSFKVALPPER